MVEQVSVVLSHAAEESQTVLPDGKLYCQPSSLLARLVLVFVLVFVLVLVIVLVFVLVLVIVLAAVAAQNLPLLSSTLK